MLAWLERYTGIAEVWLRIPANRKPEFLPAFFSQMHKSAFEKEEEKNLGAKPLFARPKTPFPSLLNACRSGYNEFKSENLSYTYSNTPLITHLMTGT